jgi:hypothetical protein
VHLRLLFSAAVILSLASAQDSNLFRFEPNSGHFPSTVHFVRRSDSNFVYITRDSVVLRNQVRIEIAGLDPSTRPQGDTPSAAKFNFYQGRDASSWRVNAPMFDGVRWSNIYPGVTARFSLGALDISGPLVVGKGRLFLTFGPGADTASFRLRVLNTDTIPVAGPSGPSSIWFVGGRIPGVFTVSATAVQVDGQNRVSIGCSLKIESADTLSLEIPNRNTALGTEVEIQFPSYDLDRGPQVPAQSADGNRYVTSSVYQPVDFGPDGRLDASTCSG